jgi:hypothetical protein
MKNLVTSLLGIAFVVVGCNIANLIGYSPPTNLQTVAASTVPQQPTNQLFGSNMCKEAKPDTVIIRDTVTCTPQPQPVKTVVKTKTDVLYSPVLYIATPIEGDDVAYSYDVHKVGEPSEAVQ